jgi:hypothetical protein
MSCNTGRLTKKKILLLSLLVAGVTVGIYFIYSTTNNPAIAVAVPALAAFAICPAMCAIMGGLIWVMNRSSKNKGKDQSHLLNDEESSSFVLIPTIVVILFLLSPDISTTRESIN